MNCNLTGLNVQNTLMGKFDRKLPSYSVDWVHGSMKNFYNVSQFIDELKFIDERLHFDNWAKWDTGLFHFDTRYCLNDKASIMILFNSAGTKDGSIMAVNETVNKYNPGIFFLMSGDGLRYLGNNTVTKIFNLLYSHDFKCSRLDVCCDIFNRDNPFVPLYLEAFRHVHSYERNKATISTQSSRDYIKIYENLDRFREGVGSTFNIEFGHKASGAFKFRVYDKWLEVKSGRLKNCSDELLEQVPDEYWYRFEFEMHKNHATSLFNGFVEHKINCAAAFKWCCLNSFKIKKADSIDKNISRIPDAKVWLDFLAFASYYENVDGSVVSLIHFVQLKYSSLSQKEKYFKRYSAMFAMADMLFNFKPDLRELVLTQGYEKIYNSPQYAPVIQELYSLFK